MLSTTIAASQSGFGRLPALAMSGIKMRGFASCRPVIFSCGDQMTQRRRLSPFVMAVGLLFLVVVPCMAQISPFGWDPNTALLTDEDWRLVWEGTVSLNRTPDVAVGETRAWSDAASGNSGKVILTRVFESNGMTCHALKYAISFSEHPVPQEYNFNWCRTPAGQWRVAS
jgi:hypothetical protein